MNLLIITLYILCSIFAQIANGIMNATEMRKSEVCKHFPRLIFLVRDCDLEAPNPEVQSKNQYLLETIMKAEEELRLFPDVSVDTLPHPSNPKDVSSDLKFKEEFDKVRGKLLRKAGQNSMNGPILADLIGKYIDAIQSGQYPKIEATRQACIDNYLKTSANQLVEEFCKKMKDEIEQDSDPKEVGLPVVFQNDFDTLKSSECRGFDTSLIGCFLHIFRPMYGQYLRDVEMYAPKSTPIHLEYLMSKIAVFLYDGRNDEQKAIRIIGGHLQDFDENNNDKSRFQCDESCQNLLHDLRRKVDTFPDYRPENFEWDSQQAIKQLQESAKGPAKEQVMEKFKSEIESLKTVLRIKQREVEHHTQLSEANSKLIILHEETAMQRNTNKELSEKNKRLTEEREHLLEEIKDLNNKIIEQDRILQSWKAERMKHIRENTHLRREIEEIRRPPKPSVPELVQDGLHDDSITIQWSSLQGFAENDTNCSYDVEVSTTGEAIRILKAREPKLTVSSLKLRTKYHFKVRGVRIVNETELLGEFSDKLSVETKDYIIPECNAPTNLRATERRCHRMTFTWDPSRDPKTLEATKCYVIKYRKRRSSRRNEQRVNNIDKERKDYQITHLQRYCTYIVQIGVGNSTGHVAYSPEAEFSTRMRSPTTSSAGRLFANTCTVTMILCIYVAFVYCLLKLFDLLDIVCSYKSSST